MSVEPQIQETPPDYEEVVAGEQCLNQSKITTIEKINVAYQPDIDKIEVAVEPDEGCKKEQLTAKSSIAAASTSSWTSSAASGGGEKTADVDTLSAEEEKMLSVLRDVAQKCTHANPLKRPTAEQVLKMLQVINPYPDGYDEDSENEDSDVRYKISKEYETRSTKEIESVSS